MEPAEFLFFVSLSRCFSHTVAVKLKKHNNRNGLVTISKRK